MKPLPLHMLAFDKSKDIKEIYAINFIALLKVKIEPIRKKTTLVSQCKNYQAFGHTKSFCNKEARCVKCSGHHATKDCKYTKLTKAKCANCGEGHPANYRGCIVAKEFQKPREKTLQERKRNNPKTINVQEEKVLGKTRQNFPPLPKADLIKQNIAAASDNYVKKTKNKPQQKITEKTSLDKINNTLQTILEKIDRQEESIRIIMNRGEKLETSNKTAVKTKK